ncbi:MAG: hypothetical protein ACTS8V_02235 [Arsenophonus sp. ER-QC15-MAG3]
MKQRVMFSVKNVKNQRIITIIFFLSKISIIYNEHHWYDVLYVFLLLIGFIYNSVFNLNDNLVINNLAIYPLL